MSDLAASRPGGAPLALFTFRLRCPFCGTGRELIRDRYLYSSAPYEETVRWRKRIRACTGLRSWWCRRRGGPARLHVHVRCGVCRARFTHEAADPNPDVAVHSTP